MIILCSAKIARTTVGHIDHALSYAVGLQRLGHQVYLIDRVGSSRCVDRDGQRVPFDQWEGRKHFEAVARAYEIWPNCSLLYKAGEASYGLSFPAMVDLAKRCDLLITRSGQIHQVPEIFENARKRIYIDGNPGSTQVACHESAGEFDALARYHQRFTMGLNIGTPVCPIPAEPGQWHPIMRPVVLPLWPVHSQSRRRYTTVSTWKGRATVNWDGRESGQKSDNWLNVLPLPRRVQGELEIAMRFDAKDQQVDRKLFLDQGWHLQDPDELKTLEDYRGYIGASRGEFSVAHNRYVEFATGWFSDRSALYLAAGKPVLVQSTGIEGHIPVGQGLLTFTNLDEAVSGLAEIEENYGKHCRAAREIAETYFNSERVLAEMLRIAFS